MMIFSKGMAKGNHANLLAMNSQYQDLNANRDDARYALPQNLFNADFAANASKVLGVNMGRRPTDLYRAFDDQVVAQFRLDEGDNILNRLMPLSRSLPIGRTVLENARVSDAGTFAQSMSGEEGSIYDKVDYDFDGTIVPISQNGFKRSFRESEQLALEGFDDLMNQQREGVRTHRQGVIGSFMNGHRDKNGQLIVEKGLSWEGVRADSRVDQVDLGAGGLNVDFSSQAITGEEFREAFISLTQRRYIDNKVTVAATYFVSNEIYFNMQRKYSNQYQSGNILENLLGLPGVAGIEPTSVLTGNQVLSMPLQSTYIQPLVGMGVSTIAVPRNKWNSPLAFEVVSAIGWKVNTDFADAGKALQYAAG